MKSGSEKLKAYKDAVAAYQHVTERMSRGPARRVFRATPEQTLPELVKLDGPATEQALADMKPEVLETIRQGVLRMFVDDSRDRKGKEDWSKAFDSFNEYDRRGGAQVLFGEEYNTTKRGIKFKAKRANMRSVLARLTRAHTLLFILSGLCLLSALYDSEAAFTRFSLSLLLGVGGLITRLQYTIERHWERSEREKESENATPKDESFTLKLPIDSAFAWEYCEVFPARMRYETARMMDDTIWTYVYDYDIRDGEHVFVRLKDYKTEVLEGGRARSYYEVINGTVLEGTIKRESKERYGESFKDGDDLKEIAHHRQYLTWYELLGPERYFILSKHSASPDFFVSERERLQEAFANLDADANKLGLVRKVEYGSSHYELQDADATGAPKTRAEVSEVDWGLRRFVGDIADAQKKAVEELFSGYTLREKYHISYYELQRQEEILYVLNSVCDGASQSAKIMQKLHNA